jgi:23S rRNA (uridine2552-2'-O)-methyltransferase
MPQPRKLHDRFFKQAKAEGYAARSAFKLLEIQERLGLIRGTDRVLDLGCAPGSWLQVLDRNLGPRGKVVGIDLSPVEVELSERVRTMEGDITTVSAGALLKLAGLRERDRFDVVVSDMAPSTSGHGDDFLSARLCERVLDLCPSLLKRGGNLIMKILEGEPTPAVIARTKRVFDEAGTTKPEASRDLSREIFIWGRGYRGERSAERPEGIAPARVEPTQGWGA